MDPARLGGYFPTQLVADYLALGNDDASGRRRHGARHAVYALLFWAGEFGLRRRSA